MSTPINQLPISQNHGGQIVSDNSQFGANPNVAQNQQMMIQNQQMMPSDQQMIQPNMGMNQGSLPDNQIVEDILREMDDPNQQPVSNINTEVLNYQMDNSQIPFEQNTNAPENTNTNYQEPQLDMSQYVEPEKTFYQRTVEQMRLPLIVLVISLVLALPIFNKLLARFIPKLLAPSGSFNMYGIMVKTILGPLLFCLINYFV
tara:strand:+ start:148 stop:753 length:606 start_codon:yes stop_codon:yes gene_type:complete